MTQAAEHITVLLHEAVEGLAIKPDGVYVDGTFGRGGHSRLILQHLGPNARLIAIDRDPQAIAEAAKIQDPRFEIVHGPFSGIASYLDERGLLGKVDGFLLDLGVSSPQLHHAERGFSFMKHGPLDMRMDPTTGQSAAQWLAKADVDDIAWVLKTFGEERFAKKIARAIVHDRVTEPYVRTRQLAEMIARVNPSKEKGKHAATRSFQAIRIYINSELDEIETALNGALQALVYILILLLLRRIGLLKLELQLLNLPAQRLAVGLQLLDLFKDIYQTITVDHPLYPGQPGIKL